MGKPVVGDVVAVLFPFSDLSDTKLRPAVVLSEVEFGDLILCQITSKAYSSKRALMLTDLDFTEGGLPVKSYVRPDKIFTADITIIPRIKGKLKHKTVDNILEAVKDLF